MIYFSTPHVAVGYEACRSLLWSEWVGAVPSEEFRRANRLILQLAEQENPAFWISNNKLATLLDPGDQTWVNEYFIPRQVKTGIQKLAIIIPDEFYNQMMLEDMISKSASIINYEIQFFAEETSAREWFREPEKEETANPEQLHAAIALKKI